MNKKIFFLLVAGLLSLVSGSAFALEVDLTRAPDIASYGSSGGSVVQWIQNFYVFSLIGGVFLAVGVITWAGLRYAIAAGNPSTQADARDQILQSLLGLLLLFGAYLILYVINPGLVQLKFPELNNVSVGPVQQGGTGGATAPATDNGTISPGATTGLFQCNVGGIITKFNTLAACNYRCVPAGGACSPTPVGGGTDNTGEDSENQP